MMSKNSIVPFLKDYLIKFLTRPFLLDTNESTMEKMTKDEQSSIIGGCQAEIDLLVANANVNGADWTDEQ